VDENVRDLLADVLPQHEPPMPLLDLTAGRRARRRDLGMRTVGLVAVVGLVATAVVLVTGSARSPNGTPNGTMPAASGLPAESPAQVFVRLDRAWRDDLPGGAVFVGTGQRSGTRDGAHPYFNGFYRLSSERSSTQVNYVVARPAPPTAAELNPCQAHRPNVAHCTSAQRADGLLITYQEYHPHDHLAMLTAGHIRQDGVAVYASVFVPGDRLAGARFPYTLAQLTAAATDPRLTFGTDVRVPASSPPASRSHNPAPTDQPMPNYPTLAPQQPCRDTALPAAVVQALTGAVVDRLSTITGAAGSADGGNAEQYCVSRGTQRTASGGASSGGASVNVTVQLTSYGDAPPANEAAACPTGALSCDLSVIAGKTAAQYEVDTGAANNLHLTVYFGTHLVVDLVQVADGNRGHTYQLNRTEMISLATDPDLIAVAATMAG
jgi:hypothetical protein